MHLSDGILSPAVCAVTAALSATALAGACAQLKNQLSTRTVPLTGMVAAMIFAGQMLNFPLFGLPVSGHLLGAVFASLVVGPAAGLVAIAIVLAIQALFFADGGLFCYGANLLNMGVAGCYGGFAVSELIRRHLIARSRITPQSATIIAAMIAGWLSVIAGSTLFCLEFAASHAASGLFDLRRVTSLMTTFHLLIGLGEAAMTGLLLNYLLLVARRSDLLFASGQATDQPRFAIGRLFWGGSVLALVLAACLSPFASAHADGLEAVAERTGFDQLARPGFSFWLSEYALPLPAAWQASSAWWEKAAVAGAGLIGTLGLIALTVLCTRALSPFGSSVLALDCATGWSRPVPDRTSPDQAAPWQTDDNRTPYSTPTSSPMNDPHSEADSRESPEPRS